MNGFGKFKWMDGRFYEGEFLNDKKHGNGKMTWLGGKIYEGPWVND